MTTQMLAHPMDEFGNGLQPYADHVLGVMKRSFIWFNHLRELSNFCVEEVDFILTVITLVCLYHDLGKLDEESQRLLNNEPLLKKYKMINHVDAGTLYCMIRASACKTWLNPYHVAAYIIHSHHLGLGYHPDPDKSISFVGFYQKFMPLFKAQQNKTIQMTKQSETTANENNYSLRDSSKVTDRCLSYYTEDTVEEYVNRKMDSLLQRHNDSLKTFKAAEDSFDVQCPFVKVEKNGDKRQVNHGNLEHVIRLILSIIVEADHGDTAESKGIYVLPKPVIDKTSPLDRLQNIKNYVKDLSQKFHDEVHSEKEIKKQNLRDLYQKVVMNYDYSKLANVHLLNGVVGGGKTIAAKMAALLIQNAFIKKNGRSARRIHYVSPLNAPGRQAAEEFRAISKNEGENPFELVGENYHDTNYKKIAKDNDMDEEFFVTASKTWDFSVIVSSCEQFFRTIFGCKTSSLRKYWNLANAIIIIDEYQTLPPAVFEALWNWMVFACKKLNCVFILVSGTPTDFHKEINNNRLTVETISSPELEEAMQQLESQRVKYIDLGKICEYDLADKIAEETQKGNTLTVVQTTVTAAYLYILLKKRLGANRVLHVSRGLCNADLNKKIEEMKKRLKKGERFAVIATSILEAGVNVSFKSVFGEYSRFTSIFQLGGRCNRHNEYDQGCVFLFGLDYKKDLITLNPGNNLSARVVVDFIKNNKLSYKYCGEAYKVEYDLSKSSREKKEKKIEDASKELDFRALAKIAHAVEPDGEDDGRTEMSIVIKSEAEKSGLWNKIINGERFEMSEVRDVSVMMKPSRADKLAQYIKYIEESDLVKSTPFNKSCVDMAYWVGTYNEIGYLLDLLDPVAHIINGQG